MLARRATTRTALTCRLLRLKLLRPVMRVWCRVSVLSYLCAHYDIDYVFLFFFSFLALQLKMKINSDRQSSLSKSWLWHGLAYSTSTYSSPSYLFTSFFWCFPLVSSLVPLTDSYKPLCVTESGWLARSFLFYPPDTLTFIPGLYLCPTQVLWSLWVPFFCMYKALRDQPHTGCFTRVFFLFSNLTNFFGAFLLRCLSWSSFLTLARLLTWWQWPLALFLHIICKTLAIVTSFHALHWFSRRSCWCVLPYAPTSSRGGAPFWRSTR